MEKSYAVPIPVISILGYEAKNWPFELILNENYPAPGASCDDCDLLLKKRTQDYRLLLGNDLLAGFDIRTNRSEGYLELVRLSSFKPYRKFMDGQSIHTIESSKQHE
jgi:hypothetical protein